MLQSATVAVLDLMRKVLGMLSGQTFPAQACRLCDKLCRLYMLRGVSDGLKLECTRTVLCTMLCGAEGSTGTWARGSAEVQTAFCVAGMHLWQHGVWTSDGVDVASVWLHVAVMYGSAASFWADMALSCIVDPVAKAMSNMPQISRALHDLKRLRTSCKLAWCQAVCRSLKRQSHHATTPFQWE